MNSEACQKKSIYALIRKGVLGMMKSHVDISTMGWDNKTENRPYVSSLLVVKVLSPFRASLAISNKFCFITRFEYNFHLYLERLLSLLSCQTSFLYFSCSVSQLFSFFALCISVYLSVCYFSRYVSISFSIHPCLYNHCVYLTSAMFISIILLVSA